MMEPDEDVVLDWTVVERGEMLTMRMAMERFRGTMLSSYLMDQAKLPFRMAMKPPEGRQGWRRVKLYSVEEVEALLERLTRENAARDPAWIEVEAGRRLTFKKGAELFPSLTRELLNMSDLPYVYARMPLPRVGFRIVRTYLTEDIEALVKKKFLDAEIDPLWASVLKGDYLTLNMVLSRYKETTEWKFRTAKLPSRAVCAETPRDVRGPRRLDSSRPVGRRGRILRRGDVSS